MLHWHLTDDQSYPFYSTSFPDLSELGSYSPRAVYNVTEIAIVVEHARERGIRVVPEFDTPGHTGSWAPAWPDTAVPCPSSGYSLMNPAAPLLYTRLNEFWTEVAKRFPDSYVHIGGDEVNLACWTASKNISAWMAEHQTTNTADVQAFHEQNVVNITNALGRTAVGWEEVFRNQGSLFPLPQSVIVDVWATGQQTLINAVKAGHRVLWSFGYYLGMLCNFF